MKPIVIKEIERSFKNVAELTQYVITQNKALMYATDRIRSLEEKIKAKEEVKDVAAKVTSIVKSIPEALCQIEIERLMEKAVVGPLDWEDTKRLDILMKNYYLAKEGEGKKKPPSEFPTDVVLTDEFLTKMALPDGKPKQ